jgi:hypothetical protein
MLQMCALAIQLAHAPQARSHSTPKPVLLMRIPYGEVPNTIPLEPGGVTDFEELRDVELGMDRPSEGPYWLRVYKDGEVLAIYTIEQITFINIKTRKISMQIEKQSRRPLVDLDNKKLYYIFHYEVPQGYVDEEGVYNVLRPAVRWKLMVYDFSDRLIESETEMLNRAIEPFVQSGWEVRRDVALRNDICYKDKKGNIYILNHKDIDSMRMGSQNIISILRISPNGETKKITINLPTNATRYVDWILIKNDKIFFFAFYQDYTGDSKVIKDNLNENVVTGYALEQISYIVYSLDGDFLYKKDISFKKEDEIMKYGFVHWLNDIKIDKDENLYVSLFVPNTTWKHLDCVKEKKYLKLENYSFEIEGDKRHLETFAITSHVVWRIDPDKKTMRKIGTVYEPHYSDTGTFPRTVSWDIDPDGNLYYLRWAKSELEIWMIPASQNSP